jgi:hypothetical protein
MCDDDEQGGRSDEVQAVGGQQFLTANGREWTQIKSNRGGRGPNRIKSDRKNFVWPAEHAEYTEMETRTGNAR